MAALRRAPKKVALVSAVVGVAWAIPAGAATHTLYIHGRVTSTGQGCSGATPVDWGYWDSATPRPGVGARAVNYDGRAHIATSNPTVRAALSAYCSGEDACYVACHSAGCPELGYAVDKYGTQAACRAQKLPATSCGPWNITWVAAAGSAAGGTELSDIGAGLVSDCLADDLRTATVRAMYDHDALGEAVADAVFAFAGAAGALTSWLLPGQDDGVVAYHSSGGVRQTGAYGNPNDWFSTVLPTGASSLLFAHNVVRFRDDHQDYSHSRMREQLYADLEASAR